MKNREYKNALSTVQQGVINSKFKTIKMNT